MINSSTFLIVFVASMLFFAYSCYNKFGLIALGAKDNRLIIHHPVSAL